MTAQVIARTNEDGIIEAEIMVDRMDAGEYAMRRAQVKVDEQAVAVLSRFGEAMDEATVRVCSRPSEARCDICGADAGWRATSWMRSYEVMLCNDHMQQRLDQYKSFDRI